MPAPETAAWRSLAGGRVAVKRAAAAVALLVAAGWAAPWEGPAPPDPAPPHARPAASGSPEMGSDSLDTRARAVILVSLDGFHPELLERAPTPVLDDIAEEGVRAKALIPVFPTHTFPNHYTAVTGLYPDHHGVIANTMYDPSAGGWFRLSDREAVGDPRWWGGEPIWVTLQEQGGTAATVFWPGSEAPIQGVRPRRWMLYDEEMSYRARVDSALAWLAPPPEGPGADFVTLYFEEPDVTAHDFGPHTMETYSAAARVDWAVGRLLAGLEERGVRDSVDLLVTSDHGMAPASSDRAIFLEDHLPEAVPLDSLRVVNWGALATLESRSGRPEVTEAALRALRGAHPRMRVFRKGQVPGRLHFGSHPRVPELVILADPGWVIWSRRALEERHVRVPPGMHGYDNRAPSMHALFLARGPSFRRRVVVEPFSMVHLYELLAHLLDVEPAPNDGSLDSARAVLR